jgi:hypothetical protein
LKFCWPGREDVNLHKKKSKRVKPLFLHLPLSFEGESKRGEASLKINLPLPLIKGKGIKGMGLLTYRHSGVCILLLAER